MSTPLSGACIFGQSGGPTSVINASAYGVFSAALENPNITTVYGAAHGIKGVLDDQLYVIDQEDPAELALLPYTPSSAMGSVRYKLKDPEVDDTDYKRILEIFKKYNVRYFFYNGGNDSMDTCSKVSRYMKSVGYECNVIGVPKTIDNDLYGTDHCPGFGSAAKYIATTCMEVSLDAKVYDTGMICIIEIMGRNAGWLAGAAALASASGEGPDLIYLPEIPFDVEKFCDDAERIYKEKGKVIIAASEGIHDKDGKFISEYAGEAAKDAFGHTQMGGLAQVLESILKTRINCKSRAIELSLMQRCGAHCGSQTDIDEAIAVGHAAVEAATSGETGYMVAIKRVSNAPYKAETELLPLEKCANFEKKVPLEWINSEGNGVTQEFVDYALPLIQGETKMVKENSLPRFARLKKVLAK
ncbi:MAG: 6-phosphofructokinase [Oscillospiraceae bacterium]|nr:6-phosphofructokinase [Oscillospiraceae bacterium]